MIKRVSNVDEKVVADEALTSSLGEGGLSPEEIGKHYAKPVRGYVVITDNDTGEVLETPNLVLLSGREFLAQKLADTAGSSLLPSSTDDLTKYKIRYFGVGIGGADTAEQPNKVGPFDNDLDLKLPGKFADDSSDTDDYPDYNKRFQYIHKGKYKKIQSDTSGSIEIVKEIHEIVVNGETIKVPAFTTIKYTMVVRKDELYKEVDESGPFAFNEAALYAVEYEDTVIDGVNYSIPKGSDNSAASRYTANSRMFARFTTLTKWLEINDSLRIEWYILV